MAQVKTPEFLQIVKDLPGAEGPVFTRDGRFFMVAPEAMKDGEFAGEIHEIDLANRKANLLAAVNIDGFGGIPAGFQCDKDNVLWLADMRLGLLRVELDGAHTQVTTTDSEDRPMQGCNDCMFDFDGNLWITAPAGPIAPEKFTRSDKENFGAFYCLTKEDRVKGNYSLKRQDVGFLFSNGIAVQHDSAGKPVKVIVAETFTKSLWAYEIVGPGQTANKTLWGKLPGELEGGPDGMDFDEMGNLLVAHWGSGHLEVFSPDGEHTCRVKCPFDKPSNVHFRPDSTEVYVTEHSTHGLWKFDWDFRGAKQYCDT